MSLILEVARLLKRQRFRISTELHLQDGLERVLDRNYPEAERFREYPLSNKDGMLGRIDYWIERVGIECKSFGANPRDTHEQLLRYSQADQVDGIILLTVRPMHLGAIECPLVIIEAGRAL